MNSKILGATTCSCPITHGKNEEERLKEEESLQEAELHVNSQDQYKKGYFTSSMGKLLFIL